MASEWLKQLAAAEAAGKKPAASTEKEANRTRTQTTSKASQWLQDLVAAEAAKKQKGEDTAPAETGAGVQAQDDTWFKSSSAWDDGYQFGDVFKTAYLSSRDLSQNILGGILDIGEAVVDTGAYLGGLFSYYNPFNRMLNPDIAEENKKKTEEFIKSDLYDGTEVIKSISNEDLVKQTLGVGTEEGSVFGEKTDSLMQSAGQLGATAALSAAGVPAWLVTGVTSFGGEAENALQNGATFEQAGLSAAITAGAEVLTEKISGGIKFGKMGTLDDAVTKALARSISDKTARTLLKFGIDVAGEGGEEVLSGVLSAVGQKLTYAGDKSFEELFPTEEAFDAFIGGMLLGGGSDAVKIVGSHAKGVDFTSGLTPQQEALVMQNYNDRVAEAEQSGKVGFRGKNAIYDNILGELRQGTLTGATQQPQTPATGGQQTSQQLISDALDDTIAQLTGAPADPVGAALEGFRQSGTVTNKQAADILNSARAVTALVEQTGVKLDGLTASGRRAAVKQAIADLSTQQQAEGNVAQTVNANEVARANEESTDESRRLTDEDLDDYMQVGERLHVRDTKQRIMDNGDSPILTKPEEIVAFIRDAFRRNIQKIVKGYGRVNNRLASAVKTATNGELNIDDYYLELDADKIAHISDHVIQDKDTRNIPLTEKQLEQLPQYIDTYDDLINVIRRKDGSIRLMLGKKINGHSIILETVSKGRKSLHPVTAYQIDSADYMKYYKTRAIDRSSTSRPANADTVDISRPAIAPDSTIAPQKTIVNENSVDGEKVSPNESVGAADQNFTGRAAYQDLLSDENSQPDRPGDVRPMEVPKVDSYGRKVSEFVGNAYGAEVTSDSFVPVIEELVQEGALGHDTKTNAESLREAAAVIEKKGMAGSRNAITKNVANGKVGDTDIAAAMLLYSKYASQKGQQSQDSAAELFVDLEMMATQTGRDLQLFKMLRKMTPQGQLMAITKKVDRYVDSINKGRSKNKQAEVSIPKELMDEYTAAAQEAAVTDTPENQQRKDAAEQAIYAYAAANIPATLKEKWDSWRYLAMLGNPKTQIRNLVGNALFRPFVETKRYLGTAMEAMVLQPEQRTKSIIGTDADSRALLSWAKQDAKTQSVTDRMEYTATTGDSASSDIGDRRQIFKTTLLEKARTGLNDLMSAEDMLFKRSAYATSLASFLKARGVTAQQVQDGSVDASVLKAARDYAVEEAMKATFNDRNAFSDVFVNFRYKGNNPVMKLLNTAAEGILPFRRTPANIVARATEYSPIGLAKTIIADSGKVRNGSISAAEYIDNLASGITGTGAMALGYALAAGIFEGVRLVGNEDDEDEKRMGHQSYALEIGDISIPIDWAAPAVLPLFMGANLYATLNPESEEVSTSAFTAFLDACANTLEPMLELSCLSSLNDLLTDVRYAEEGRELYAIAASAATSYLLQGLPTLGGQIEQAFEEEKKSVYADSSDPFIREVQQTIGRATQKIPGIDLFQTEKVDAWGEPQEKKGVVESIFDAFINPAYDSQIEETAVDAEISRLNSVQSENVSPRTPSKTITYTGTDGTVHTDKRLTSEEYSSIAKQQGQKQKTLVEDILASSAYADLSDADKAKAISYAYEYARDYARMEVLPDYPGFSSKWMAELKGDIAEGIIRKTVVGTTEKYASLPIEKASYVDDLLDSILPPAGKTYATQQQKIDAVTGADGNLTDKEQRTVLKDVLSDSAYDKFLEILELGYSNDDYADSYRIYSKEKETGGKGTKARTIAAFQKKFGISENAATTLYEIYNPK